MTHQLINYGSTDYHYNVARTKLLRCTREMSHSGLKEHKLISAPDKYILSNKCEIQEAKWTEKWEIVQSKNMLMEEKNNNLQFTELSNCEAHEIQNLIENLLIHSLSINSTIKWDNLKDHSVFNDPKPKLSPKESYKIVPIIPNSSSLEFIPRFTLWDKLFKSKKEEKEMLYQKKYEDALAWWESNKKKIKAENIAIDEDYQNTVDKWKLETEIWESREKEYYDQQNLYNLNIDELEQKFVERDPIAVMEYFEMVLNNSEYPEFFPKNFEIEYNNENQIFIVEYDLPDLNCFPNIKEVKYIASSKKINKTFVSDSELNRIFENTLYKVALRTLHELFEADTAGALKAVSFNGWVNSVNKATGIEENKCILSLQAKKEEFVSINLANVDPKVCFKSLKGVASSKLRNCQ